MSEYTSLCVYVPFKLDPIDLERIQEYEWDMDLNGNVFTPIKTDKGIVNCTLGRMIANFYHTIQPDECVRYKNGDSRDNRMENLEIVKRDLPKKEKEYPPSTPIPDKQIPLPKYVYQRVNGKFDVCARISGTTKFLERVDTLEEAISLRKAWEPIEAKCATQNRPRKRR